MNSKHDLRFQPHISYMSVSNQEVNGYVLFSLWMMAKYNKIVTNLVLQPILSYEESYIIFTIHM